MLKAPSIAILINAASGTGTRHKSLYKALETRQDVFQVYEVGKSESTVEIVRKAWNLGCKTIVAAGGDGTVSMVASAIVELGIEAKLGVIPLGTLNHFARDIRMPYSVEAALNIIESGKSIYIDVAKVNDRYFINNSSLGLYPFVVTNRDQVKRKGFRKWIRFIGAAFKALKKYPFVQVTIITADKEIVRKTPFVFIGNNGYDIRAGRLGMRQGLQDGKLSLHIAHKGSRFRLLMLAWHALRGTIAEQRDFDILGLASLEIKTKKKRLKVACDGEVYTMKTPIQYSIVPRALHVIIP